MIFHLYVFVVQFSSLLISYGIEKSENLSVLSYDKNAQMK